MGLARGRGRRHHDFMLNRRAVLGIRWVGWRALTVALLLCALGVGAAGVPVTVQDDRGREIEIPAAPERLVILQALYGEIAVALGAAGRVVGIVDSPNIPEQLEGLPLVGTAFEPSVEYILALDPDLVLGGWGEVRAGLERAGARVLTLGQEDGYIGGLTDLLAAVRSVGRALGEEEEAARLVGEIAVEVVETEAAVLERRRVRVAFLFMYAPDSPPYAIGTGAVEHELILRAGGANVFADVAGFPLVALEEGLARNPEVIFTDPTQVEHILESRLLEDVTAVAEGRVYGIQAADTVSTRVARALREMAQRLHPQAFEGD